MEAWIKHSCALGEGGLQTTTGKTALDGGREEQSPPGVQVPWGSPIRKMMPVYLTTSPSSPYHLFLKAFQRKPPVPIWDLMWREGLRISIVPAHWVHSLILVFDNCLMNPHVNWWDDRGGGNVWSVSENIHSPTLVLGRLGSLRSTWLGVSLTLRAGGLLTLQLLRALMQLILTRLVSAVVTRLHTITCLSPYSGPHLW